MSNSKLVTYTKLSPHCTKPRNDRIRKITIHHAAGNLSIETTGQVFQVAEASANYGVGTDGRIALYVDEANRAWTSSSPANDHQAVTIEVSNDGGAPNWHVSDKAIQRTIELCFDICQRNGIKSLNYTGDETGNLTTHDIFKATQCPGSYLKSRMASIAEEVNKMIDKANTPIGTGDNPSAWAKPATDWCKQYGIFKGDGKGNYGWQEPVTREALAQTLYNFWAMCDGAFERMR